MHTIGVNRRAFVTAASSLAAVMLTSPAIGSRALRRAGDGAIRINGNIGSPFDGTKPLSPRDVAQVRDSRLAAFKLTMGGANQSRPATLDEIDETKKAIAANASTFTQILGVRDIAAAHRSGRTGVVLSFEGGSMHEGSLDSIDAFRRLGVLIMGLSYNQSTAFGSGIMSPDHSGLTALGREAIARMESLGVTLDISHSDEPTSVSAMAASRRPVLITHAGCSAVHSHPRNKPDALLRSLARTGGVFGIYELAFLSDGKHQQSLADYMAHMLHALKVMGEDHVGVGTDGALGAFDTSPASMAAWDEDIARRKASGVGAPGEGPPPFVEGLNRPDRMDIIATALRKAGVRSAAIDKILGLNFLRVFNDTWAPTGRATVAAS